MRRPVPSISPGPRSGLMQCTLHGKVKVHMLTRANMRKGRIPGWLVLTLAAVGLLLVIPGLWVFVSLTATPLYPNPEGVPTVMHSSPLPKWAGAVEQARQ